MEYAIAMSDGFAPSVGGIVLLALIYGAGYLAVTIFAIWGLDWLRKYLTRKMK